MSEATDQVGSVDEEAIGPIETLFDDDELAKIRESARSRSESLEFFVRDAILGAVADQLGEEGHLECWVEGCEETFTTERKRRGHVGRSHSDNLPEGDFWCGICGYGPTTYTGVGAHHGHRHTGEEVRPLDHEPDEDELLDPDDVPDHMDRELLDRLYHECDGSYTEMCRQHGFEVTPGRVRHYLIEFGIHEPTPRGEDAGPPWRNREWLLDRYEAADGNIAEMHRELQRDGYNVPYRTLVKSVNRFDFHDPTDPPGKHHRKGGPKPSSSVEQDDQGDQEDVDDEPVEDLGTGEDLPPEERAFVPKWGIWGPPQGGTYHTDVGCQTLNRSDLDTVPVPLPWPRSELEEDDDWKICGHCARAVGGANVDIGDKLDHTDPEDLRDAFERHDGVISRAAEEFAVSDMTVRKYLIEHGIYDPDAKDEPTDDADEPDPEGDTVPEVDRFWCGRCGKGSGSEVGVKRHNGMVHEGDPIIWDVEPAEEDLVGDVRENPLAEDEEDDESERMTIEWDFEPGWTTVGEQEEDDHDRVIEDANCVRCGEPYEGEGVCDACSDGVVDELVTDGGTVQIEGHCPCCGEPYGPGDYRCDGELPDGTRCGKDLVDAEGGDPS